MSLSFRSFHNPLLNRIGQSKILSGALILTMAGFLSKCIGFLFRIFLSRTFGAENIGIYQLVSPVMAIAYALSVSGIQTAISKLTATLTADKNSPFQDSYTVLAIGLFLSLFTSVLISFVVYGNASYLASHYLKEVRTAPLLRVLAFSFPVSAIHSCITGYFLGLKKASFPAVSQLIEQCIRVASIILLCHYSTHIHIAYAVAGIVIGESFSALISIFYFIHHMQKKPFCLSDQHYLPQILQLSMPLTMSRITQNILQSIEAVAIPEKLQQYGHSTQVALSHYGILTGMALPLILFPTALTHSLAVMLLPAISEAHALGEKNTISRYLTRSVQGCLLLGFFFTTVFFLGSPLISSLLFREPLAGTYIRTLSFICPFLYINGTLTGIMHGLGRTFSVFLYSTICLAVRLPVIYFLVPRFGMQAYLVVLLASQILLTVLQINNIKGKH